MEKAVDLVCNEVILEELIEPPAPGKKFLDFNASNNGFSRSTPLTFPEIASGREQDDKGEDDETPRTAQPTGRRNERKRKMRSSNRSVKRRKLWAVEESSSTSSDEGAQSNTYLQGSQLPRESIEDPIHAVLPPEIQWNILKRLKQTELLPLRRISRKWKDTVDKFFKVSVTLHGDSKDFKGQCSLSMRTCKMLSFQDPSFRHLFQAPTPHEVIVERGICAINFEELVLQWNCITKLELCWRSTMKNFFFEKKGLERLPKQTILPNLRSLKMGILINDSLGQNIQRRIQFNVTNLLNYDYPNLMNFKITFVGYRELHSENRHLANLLPFISRHARSLCEIDFTLSYASHVVYPPPHPRHILFCVPANIRNHRNKAPQTAVDGHLVTTLLRKPALAHVDCEDWVDMLTNRRKLELAITTRFLSWSIKHLDFFEPTISEYGKFLRRIDIMNVTMYDSGAHNTVTQLDARIFRDCSQLSHLRIFRAPIIFHEDEIDPPTELINLPHLPTTLEELVIDGLPVSSSEILATISEMRLLKTFHYFQSQVPRRNMLNSNGINWSILKCIVKHSTLVNVKVHAGMTTLGHAQYEGPLKTLAREHGWSTTGIVPGYMSMFQVTLTKSSDN